MASIVSPIASAAAPRRWPVKLAYGLGSIAFGVKDNGFQVLLLLFYNQVLGLDARLAGLAIMIALIVDAFADPVIGYLSDRLRSRLGRRHPFMYAAAIPVALCYLFLFSPPHGLDQTQLFAYLLGVSVLVRVLISIYEIPSSALVAELTQNYYERTSFLSLRYFFGWIGGLSMSILAFSVFLKADAARGTDFLDLAGYKHYGMAASAIMFVSIMVSALGTQAAVRPIEEQALHTKRARNIAVELWDTMSSPSSLAAMGAGTLMLLATGLTFSLGTYFNIYAWGFGPDQISILTGSLFVSATLALILSPWVARTFEKRGAAIRVAIALIVLVPVPLAANLLGVATKVAPAVVLPYLLCFNVVTITLFIMVPILISSMLADVVEEVEVKTGRREEGVIFAFNTFVQKCATGLGIFLATAILSAARFPAHARVGAIDPAVITRLASIYIATVIALYIGSVVCIRLYRITREVHARNLKVLAER